MPERQSFSVEFEFRLPVIFLQSIVLNMQTSSDLFTATSLSFPPETCINKQCD